MLNHEFRHNKKTSISEGDKVRIIENSPAVDSSTTITMALTPGPSRINHFYDIKLTEVLFIKSVSILVSAWVSRFSL
jgi:hypothetical protein